MKVTISSAILLAGTVLAGVIPATQASSGTQGRPCIARVLYSEELPFAPANYWLVKVILEIIPPDSEAYQIALQDKMPWQAPLLRQGQTFKVQCDPAHPTDLHLVY